MASQLQSSNDFDHINYARSFAATQEKPFSCFQFVTHVLAQNAPLAHQELMKNHKIILQNIMTPIKWNSCQRRESSLNN